MYIYSIFKNPETNVFMLHHLLTQQILVMCFITSNATNSLKCLCVFHFFQSSMPYMQISDMIPGVNIICGKVSIASVKGAGRI